MCTIKTSFAEIIFCFLKVSDLFIVVIIIFLEEMEQVAPWIVLCRVIEPCYPQAGNGRPSGGDGADAADLFSAQRFTL